MSTFIIYRNVLLAGASAALLVSVGACSRDNGISAGAGSGGGVASTAGSGSTTASGDTSTAAGADGTGATGSAGGGDQLASNGTGSGASGSAAGSGGSGSTGAGATGGSGTTGSGSGSGSGSTTTASDGTVARVANVATGATGGALVTTGNALLGATGGAVGAPVSALGSSLQGNGLAAVPVAGSTLASTAKTADGLVNPNAKVVVLNTPLVGSSSAGSQQLYGVSALTPAVAGQNATVGVLNNGLPSASTTTGLVRADTVSNISVGQNGSNLVGASVLSPASPQGSVATVNVHPSTLSQPVSVVGVGSPTGAVSSLTGAVGSVPATATSLAGR